MQITTRDNEIVLIKGGGNTSEMRFQIDQLLNDYGEPDSVFIQAFSDPGSPPFILILLYSNYQAIAKYFFFPVNEKDQILGCPPFGEPEIFIWSHDIKWTDQIIQEEVFGVNTVFIPRPIEDVTDTTTESFYLDFKKPSTECIKTPKIIWP